MKVFPYKKLSILRMLPDAWRYLRGPNQIARKEKSRPTMMRPLQASFDLAGRPLR
jgi:hypothetical protein